MWQRRVSDSRGGLLLLMIASVFLMSAGCSVPRGVEALNLVGDIAAGSGASRFKATTPTPVRTTIQYTFEGGTHVADIYRPGGGDVAEAATILVPGVVRKGKDDARLVAFAQTLARAQFLVFVPDLANLRQLSVSSRDAQALSRAVRFLAQQSGVGRHASVGIVALSYAAGPALLAATAEETRRSVRFVYAIGPYFDIRSTIAFLTTGHFRAKTEDPWFRAAPSPYAVWVFVRSCAVLLRDPADRRTLTAMADNKIDDPQADISDMARRLGPEGRRIFDLLENDDPDKVGEFIAGLPEAVRDELRRLDVSGRDIGDFGARLILIHGRDDTLIPYTESLALETKLTNARVDLFVVDSLQHVELRGSGFRDILKLWRASRMLLDERDRMPRPSWVG